MSPQSKQFKHTTNERRSSVIHSSSIIKGGIFTPVDYIPQEESAAEDQDVWGDENGYESLLSTNNSHTLREEGRGVYGATGAVNEDGTIHKTRRQSSYSRDLLEEERDLLLDNKLISDEGHLNSVPEEQEEEQIRQTWEEALKSGKNITTTYRRECQVLVKNAFPLVFTFVMQNSLSLASVFTTSRLGIKELGGITLGSMTANITGFAAIQGLCTCLDTLCSQAYGAKNYQLVGILLQRCAIITIIFFTPILFMWWFWSEAILAAVIPERELCKLAANYLKIVALGVPGFVFFECGKRFLQCQGIFHASTIVLLLSLIHI